MKLSQVHVVQVKWSKGKALEVRVKIRRIWGMPNHKLQRQKKTRSKEMNSFCFQFQDRSLWTLYTLHGDGEASSFFIITISHFPDETTRLLCFSICFFKYYIPCFLFYLHAFIITWLCQSLINSHFLLVFIDSQWI